MAMEIVLSPDERLRRECAPVGSIDDEVRRLARQMAETMYAYDGCGIAAPQVGVLRQIVVIDCDWGGDGPKKPIYLVNPVVTERSEEKMTWCEGCLSIPGVSFDIERSASVTVRALDLEGRLMQYEASGNLFCACLQHEIDHLHGKTMFERLTPMARLRGIREYQEALAAGARPGETQ